MKKEKYTGTNFFNTIYSFVTRKPNNNASISFYANRSKATNSGEIVSTDIAIAEATIFTCVNIIAQGIAQLPIISSRYTKLFEYPNEYQTQYEFIYSIIYCLLCYGNAFIRMMRSDNGTVQSFVILDPTLVTVSVNNANIPVYIHQQDTTNPIKYDDMIHIKDVSTFEVQGLSRVLLCAERIGCLKGADRQIAENFNNGVDIKYSIETPDKLDPELKKELSDGINEFFSAEGEQRGGAMLLEGGAKINQLKGMTVADTDLRQVRAMLIKEIASIFRVPSYMVGQDGDQKYSNVRQTQTALYRDTYLPVIVSIEQAFRKKQIDFSFDVGSLLKGDIESQIRVSTQAVQSGIITPNEARMYLGYDPIDEDYANQLNPSKTMGVADQRGTEVEPNEMNTDVTNNDGREENARSE